MNCIYILCYDIKDRLERDHFGFEGSIWEFDVFHLVLVNEERLIKLTTRT